MPLEEKQRMNTLPLAFKTFCGTFSETSKNFTLRIVLLASTAYFALSLGYKAATGAVPEQHFNSTFATSSGTTKFCLRIISLSQILLFQLLLTYSHLLSTTAVPVVVDLTSDRPEDMDAVVEMHNGFPPNPTYTPGLK